MISTTTRAQSFTPDGIKTVFDVNYAVVDASSISVTEDASTITSFTVSNISTSGATVTFLSAPTANSTLTITRTTPITQLVDYVPNEAFNAETHEGALDKLTLILQEYSDDLGRAIKAPIGSTTQTRVTTAFYGKYLGFDSSGDVVALEETVGSGTGSSNFDLADSSDVDVINVAAGGTTTITLPDTDTTIFGAYVTASAGGGSYTHNIKLPAPGTAGQRGFIRFRMPQASTNPTLQLLDESASPITSARISSAEGVFSADIRVVSTGAAWTVDDITYGQVCYDRHQGTSYVVNEWSEFVTAIADAGNAVIFINSIITVGSSAEFEVPSRHRLVFAKGASISAFSRYEDSHIKIDCEIITAQKDQTIFTNGFPGTFTGNFGGLPRNAAWWDSGDTGLLGLFPTDWQHIQSGVWACDWITTAATPVTVSSWNSTTDYITVPDTTDIREGDIVKITGGTTIPSGLVEGRPYIVVNATNGAGSTLSTFQLQSAPDWQAINFGSGGSVDVTIARAAPATSHEVRLPKGKNDTYSLGRPIAMQGTGAILRGNGGTILASASDDWRNNLIEGDIFAAGSPQAFTGATTVMTAATHGYLVGDLVEMTSLSTPGNLTTTNAWYVESVPTANTFTLSTTSGGSAITVGTSAGNVRLAGGHAPMVIMGEATPSTWTGLATGVSGLTLDANLIPGLSCIGARGFIPAGSFVEDCELKKANRHYIGWSKTWVAAPGYAATNDNSRLTVDKCRMSGIDQLGNVVPSPMHLPGYRSLVRDSSIAGDAAGSPQIFYGASQKGLVIKDVEWSNALNFLTFPNDALYLAASLDNIAGTSTPGAAITCPSTTVGTDVVASTAHGLSDGDLITNNGVGTVPTGWTSGEAYVISSATTNSFKIATYNGGTEVDLTTDNGSFEIVQVGAVVNWTSSQATAKVTANAVTCYGREAIVHDSTTHNRTITGADTRSLAVGQRRGDFISWGVGGYTAISDGVIKCNTLILDERPTQLTMPIEDQEIALMNFNTAGPERSLVLKVDDAGTVRWKFIKATLAGGSPTWVGQSTDPEI